MGAAKWERAEVSRRSFSALSLKVVRTVAFSVAFILTLRHIRAYKGHVGPAQWKGGDWAGSKKRK